MTNETDYEQNPFINNMKTPDTLIHFYKRYKCTRSVWRLAICGIKIRQSQSNFIRRSSSLDCQSRIGSGRSGVVGVVR